MALINCPECGKQVSDQAPACIHCGYPLNKQEERSELVIYGTKQQYLLNIIQNPCKIYIDGELVDLVPANDMTVIPIEKDCELVVKRGIGNKAKLSVKAGRRTVVRIIYEGLSQKVALVVNE